MVKGVLAAVQQILKGVGQMDDKSAQAALSSWMAQKRVLMDVWF